MTLKSMMIGKLLAFSCNVFAGDVAQCSNPKGTTYLPELGIVTKSASGWGDDAINGGLVALTKISKDKFDIIFVDSTKNVTSSVNDGGTVFMLNRDESSVSFIVVYPGKTVEIYTFLTNKSGKSEYIHMTSRGGNQVLIAKATLMRGDCSYINFDELSN